MRNLFLLLLSGSIVLASVGCADNETAVTPQDASVDGADDGDVEEVRDIVFRDLGLDSGADDATAEVDSALEDATDAGDALGFDADSGADALEVTDGAGDTDAAPCESDCARAGAGQCTIGGLQTCTFNAATGCLNWSEAVSCGADRRCELDECVDGACIEECFFDGVACSLDNTQLEGCEDVNLDGCREVVVLEVCTGSSVCNTGACVTASCTNECELGETLCSSGGVLGCGNYDTDICREFGGAVTPCDTGFVCSAGACAPEGCTNDCSPGQTTCTAGGVQGCGNFDGDLCLEFGGPAVACAAGLTCVAGTCSEVAAQCLLISEYLEGASSDKAIELFNCGSESYDLSRIGFCSRQNAETTGCFPPAAPLTGNLAPGATFALCNSRSASALRSRCDELVEGFPNFNGNDRLFVFRDNDNDDTFSSGDVIIDSFGEPGAAVSGTPYADIAFRRCSTEAYTSGPFDVTRYYREASSSDFTNIGVAPVVSGCE
jgi:hypothetical protein